MKTWLDHTLNVLSVCGLIVIGYAFLKPGGAIREGLTTWIATRHQLESLRQRWPELTAAGARLGRHGGRIVAVEFADYECPYCRKIAPAVDSLLARNDSIDMVFIHLPLSIHPAAAGAARASICAEEQGHFQQMHWELMTSDEWERDTNWVREGARADVPDMKKFVGCLTAQATESRLRHDQELGAVIGAIGTPTFATDTRRWAGAVLPAQFWLRDRN